MPLKHWQAWDINHIGSLFQFFTSHPVKKYLLFIYYFTIYLLFIYYFIINIYLFIYYLLFSLNLPWKHMNILHTA